MVLGVRGSASSRAFSYRAVGDGIACVGSQVKSSDAGTSSLTWTLQRLRRELGVVVSKQGLKKTSATSTSSFWAGRNLPAFFDRRAVTLAVR